MSPEPNNPKRKPLVSVEWQREVDVSTGTGETRMFVKMYFEARDSGLLAALGPVRWQTLCVLATYMDQEGKCYPSQALVAKDLGIARETVNRRIQEVLNFRFGGQPVLAVSKNRTSRPGGSRWANNVYEIRPIAGFGIFDQPEQPTSTPQTDQNLYVTKTSHSPQNGQKRHTQKRHTNKNHVLNKKYTRVFSSSTESRELVLRFYELRGLDKPSPTTKELTQAAHLISTHGPEKAAFLVTHGLNTATERFGSPPEAFGGILRFVDNGAAAYDQLRRRQERERQNQERAKAEQARLEAERAARDRLSPEQRIELRLKRFPKKLFPPRKFQEIRRQIYEEEGLQPPA